MRNSIILFIGAGIITTFVAINSDKNIVVLILGIVFLLCITIFIFTNNNKNKQNNDLTTKFNDLTEKYNNVCNNGNEEKYNALNIQYEELNKKNNFLNEEHKELHEKYNERCEFIEFIQYLFDNETHIFNLLPKVCLVVDKCNEYNDLHVRKMLIEYNHDMSKTDTSDLKTGEEWVTYNTTIDFFLDVENDNLPKNYVFFGGNMSAIDKDKTVVTQRHGEQKKYTAIPNPDTKEKAVSMIVSRHNWVLSDKSNINPFPICFKMEFNERAKANSFDEIIFYPKKYAKSIDTVTFKIKFNHSDKILTRAQLYRIEKNKNNQFDTISIEEISGENEISFDDIKVDSTKYEAYYIKFFWNLL